MSFDIAVILQTQRAALKCSRWVKQILDLQICPPPTVAFRVTADVAKIV